MKRYALLFALVTSPLPAQTATDSARVAEVQRSLAVIKIREDSLLKEACRNGTVTATGGCVGSAGTPRVSYLRRHALVIRRERVRVDSIVRAWAPTTPPPAPINPPATNADWDWYYNSPTPYFPAVGVDTVTLCAVSKAAPRRLGWPPARETRIGLDSASFVLRSGNPLSTMCGYAMGRAGLTTTDSTAVTWRTDTVTLSGRLSYRAKPAALVSPPPVDSTPTPTPTPTPTLGIAAPELPRVVPPSSDPYPGRACTVTVASGGDVTAALTSARGGQVVCLTAGATYGISHLPARATGDTGWIVLRTNTTLPTEGTRMRPSTAASLAKIFTTANGTPALTTAPGTFGYAIRGVEIGTAANVTITYALIALGDVGPNQDTMAEAPQKLVFSQVYIHGSASGEMQRCVALNSGATAIVDSWLSDCHGTGYDSQAIGGWNGPGPHLIRNNYLEGVGENVMWGGATPSIPNMVAGDITFQRNHVYTPIAWKGVWTKKNLFELKNAVRVLIEDNVFDGSWADAQIGPALLFKSINDMGTCNWCRTTDVTVRRNLVKNAGGGIVFSGAENYNTVGTVDSVAKRFLIQDAVFDGINVAPYDGGGRGMQITAGASDIVFDRTVFAGNIGSMMVFDICCGTSPRTAFKNSVWTHGVYFATASGPVVGLPSMNAGIPGFLWENMAVVRHPTESLNQLPAGTLVLDAENAQAASIRATVTSAIAGVVILP